jgi:MFS family permease
MGTAGEARGNKARGGNGMVAIFLTIFIDLVGFSIIFPLLPSILALYLPREGPHSFVGSVEAFLLSASPASSSGSSKVLALVLIGGALGSLYSILQFMSSPVWGRLSDRFGRRNILLFTTSFTCLGYVVWMFSGSFWLYVLSRVLNGMMAGNLSVATAAVADVTSKGERTRGMAIIGVAFGLGFMIGPAIGGVASLVDLAALWPETVRFGITPFSFAAFVSLSLATINLVWVALFFPETLPPENRMRHLISFNPLSNLMVDNSATRRVIIVDFTFLIIFSGMEFTLTFLALERLNFGPVQNIAIFVFGGVVMTLVQSAFTNQKAARTKFGMKNIVAFGVILGLAGMFILAFATNVTVFFTGLFFKACGIALLAPTITALVSLYTPPNKQGAVMGTFRATGSLARAIGPIFAAILYWAIGSKLTFIFGSLVLILPLCLAVRLPNPKID